MEDKGYDVVRRTCRKGCDVYEDMVILTLRPLRALRCIIS